MECLNTDWETIPVNQSQTLQPGKDPKKQILDIVVWNQTSGQITVNSVPLPSQGRMENSATDKSECQRTRLDIRIPAGLTGQVYVMLKVKQDPC